MKRHPMTRSLGLAVAALAGAVTVAACSTGSGEGADPAPAPAPSTSAPTANAAAPVGPGCAGLPASGPGSAEAMAQAPVATAAAQNPQLSTLVSAVTAAGLADTLNTAEAITVFAPTNDAFAKIPKSTLDGLLADKQALTDILTYHVVKERRAVADLEAGSLTTLQGGAIATAKSGETYTANGARVVCGNVQTRNATVHVIDTVLIPKP